MKVVVILCMIILSLLCIPNNVFAIHYLNNDLIIGESIKIDHYGPPQIFTLISTISGISTQSNESSTTFYFHSGDKFDIPNIYLKHNFKIGDSVKFKEIKAIPICKIKTLYLLNATAINTDFLREMFYYIDVEHKGFGKYLDWKQTMTLTGWQEYKNQMDVVRNMPITTYDGKTNTQYSLQLQPFELNSDKSCFEKTFYDLRYLQ